MPSFVERHFGRSLSDVQALGPDQRAAAARSAIPDLHFFFDEDRALGERAAPERTRALAVEIHRALSEVERHGAAQESSAGTLRERIVTDALLRSEADRDQNVYLGRLFTRSLTNALPDVIVQPESLAEVTALFRWARSRGVPLTLRGAGTTAMGGSVPNDGGMTLDLSRLDRVDVEAREGTVIVGAGARLRVIHERLAELGRALPVYPSNLGGTLAGWFVSGGYGLNAFSQGGILPHVLAVDAVLPGGEHVLFHADGRVVVPGDGDARVVLAADQAAGWFRGRGMDHVTMADLAASEGTLGLVLQLTVRIEPRPELGAFLLGFDARARALEAIEWVARSSPAMFPRPANLKLFSASHAHHVERVWAQEDARPVRAVASTLTAGDAMPWTRIAGPRELGFAATTERLTADTYLFVDFTSLDAARAFAASLAACPGSPAVLGEPSARFAAERFRPQQTKRLGPGLLAAEVLLPASRLAEFLPAAERVAAGAGVELDHEVYLLDRGQALVIAGYLTDHRRASFHVDLMVAPAITELAMSRFGGRPYVLGRWQSAWFERAAGAHAVRLRSIRASMDPNELVNRGVYTGLRLRGPLGGIVSRTFEPGIAMLSNVLATPAVSWLVRGARALMAGLPGPAAGRGAPVPASTTADDAALHCVNCGECNSVCPIFHESKIRLPQMLTHIGESVRAGEAPGATAGTLLDLCMRCGNCEEVCQAGIPHLDLYARTQEKVDREIPPDRERHVAILAAVRGSAHYRREFLDVREGGYLKRSPVALPGVARYVLLRAENDAGAVSTCIHCGACVAVCPTEANREFEDADPRLITTIQDRCIGCGTCVEVCPANLANGGRTLRVMEAPTPDWYLAIEEYTRETASKQPPSEAASLPIQ